MKATMIVYNLKLSLRIERIEEIDFFAVDSTTHFFESISCAICKECLNECCNHHLIGKIEIIQWRNAFFHIPTFSIKVFMYELLSQQSCTSSTFTNKIFQLTSVKQNRSHINLISYKKTHQDFHLNVRII